MLTNNDKSSPIEEHYLDLLKEAERGNSFLVMTFLSANSCSNKSKDTAFRRCLRSFRKEAREKEEQEDYMKCIRSFVEHYEDFDYRNPDEDKKTILMEVCWLGLKEVFELILKSAREASLSINFNLRDNNEETLLHKLISSPNFSNEEQRVEMMAKLVDLGVDIDRENSKGYSPLAIALLTGNSKISSKLLSLGVKISSVCSTGDSLLHCAVLGKNPLCVTLLIEREKGEELKKAKNGKGETPIDIAVKLGLTKLIQILGDSSFNYSIGNNVSGPNKLMSMIQPLEEFRVGNFLEAIRLLNDLKRDDSKQTSLSLEWNILITQYVNDLNTKLTLNSIDSNLINATRINMTAAIEKFFAFFKTLEAEDSNRISKNNLLFYNLVLFQFKLGNYKKVMQTIFENKILNKSTHYIDTILYINSSLLLINILINLRSLKVASVILDNLEEYLNTNLKGAKEQKDGIKSNISEYLNSCEMINGIMSVDCTLCILSLFKAHKLILENKSEESKKSLKEYKRIYTNCKYVSQLPIFYTMKNLYHYLKIKIDYNNNSIFKCYKHLNSLNSMNNGSDNNLTKESEIERQLFYYNAIGIINIRQKKYSLARCFFKHCILLIKQSANVNGKIQKECANWAASAKFNIGLCYFFEKNYTGAYLVFTSILKFLSHSPFLLYRAGLCCLELELAGMKGDNRGNYNEIVEKLIGYKEKSDKDVLNSLPLSPINKNAENNADLGGAVQNDYSSSVRRVVLRNNLTQEDLFGKAHSNYLLEAIKYFKQTILLLKDNVNFKKQVEEVYRFYAPEKTDADQTQIEIKSYNQIMISSYLNLIFSLILNEEWNEVLFFCDEFERNPSFNREIEYTTDNYKIEAYLALNQHKDILEVLKKNMLNNNFSYTALEFKGSFYNKVNKLVYSEINYKLALYINIIKMNFITNNLIEVEKGIMSILNMLNVNLNVSNGTISQSDLPPYILNLIIYFLMIKENFEAALTVIKRRRIPPYFAQNLITPGAKLPFNMK